MISSTSGSSSSSERNPYRAGDLDALAQAIVALSQLAVMNDALEAEINPLIVRTRGEGVVAVDALVRVV
jgi:succinyl-CoA synthetase beta subunit